jgi:hypothetical protein
MLFIGKKVFAYIFALHVNYLSKKIPISNMTVEELDTTKYSRKSYELALELQQTK